MRLLKLLLVTASVVLMSSYALANVPPGLQKKGLMGIPSNGKVPPGWNEGLKRGWNKDKNWHWNKETHFWENKHWRWDGGTHAWVKTHD